MIRTKLTTDRGIALELESESVSEVAELLANFVRSTNARAVATTPKAVAPVKRKYVKKHPMSRWSYAELETVYEAVQESIRKNGKIIPRLVVKHSHAKLPGRTISSILNRAYDFRIALKGKKNCSPAARRIVDAHSKTVAKVAENSPNWLGLGRTTPQEA